MVESGLFCQICQILKVIHWFLINRGLIGWTEGQGWGQIQIRFGFDPQIQIQFRNWIWNWNCLPEKFVDLDLNWNCLPVELELLAGKLDLLAGYKKINLCDYFTGVKWFS